jgi:hypothetical protein
MNGTNATQSLASDPHALVGRRATEAYHRRRDAGFTILELSVYMALTAVLSAPIVSAMLVGTKATTETDTYVWLQERNRTALHKLTKDVRNSIAATLVVDGANGLLTFTLPAGFDGVNVVDGPSVTYSFQTTDGVPWGELVRTNNTTNTVVGICGGVDLANSGFQPSGTGVRITLTNAVDPNDPTAHSFSTTVSSFPRN